MSSYFYLQAEKTPESVSFLNSLEAFATSEKQLIYVLNRPLTDQKYDYSYSEALIILSPKHKIAILNNGRSSNFENYVEDIIEDIGSISDKYLYKEIIGRPRTWRHKLVKDDLSLENVKDIALLFQGLLLDDESEKKKIDLLI